MFSNSVVCGSLNSISCVCWCELSDNLLGALLYGNNALFKIIKNNSPPNVTFAPQLQDNCNFVILVLFYM